MDRALYGPDGFYQRGGQAGRRGDFITSPEVGPLFAEVLANALAGTEHVIEVGGGAGTLARDILRVRAGLRYTIVERSAALRASAAERVPDATVVEQMPEASGATVIANELLDNLPFDLFEFRDGEWLEVRVDEGVEVLEPSDEDIAALVPDPPTEGARVPLQRAAAKWVSAAQQRGRVIAIDYCDITPSMAARPWQEWLRTYKGHAPGGHPLDLPGSQDITTEVAVDQLPPPTHDRSQADFLRAHGLDDLVEQAKVRWQERAAIGDLEAMKARSRVSEARAVTDPGGLGGFRVLQWGE